MSDFLDIHALADGQLEGEERAAAEARLRSCEKSQAEFRAVQTVRDTLQSKCSEITCEDTWRKCQSRLRELDRTRRVESFVGRYAWGMCSIFIVAIVMAASLNRMGGTSLSTGDVARASSTLIPFGAPRSQAPDDQRKWLEGVMNGPMPSQPESVEVIGGAAGKINGHKMVRINLADSIGTMAFFMMEDVQRIADAESVSKRGFSICKVNGTNAVGWSEGPRAFLLIGERPIDDLESVAVAIRGRK